MVRLSELQNKKIISVVTGKNIGNIIDVDIHDDGKIDSFIIEQSRNFFTLNRESDTRILWNDITKVGEDVILVQKD